MIKTQTMGFFNRSVAEKLVLDLKWEQEKSVPLLVLQQERPALVFYVSDYTQRSFKT